MRKALFPDYERIVQIAQQWNNSGLSYWHLVYSVIQDHIGKGQILVALHPEKQRIVGFCDYQPRKRTPGLVVIENIAIDKDFLGQGFGYALFRKLNLSYPFIQLKCPEELPANERYQRWGGELLRKEQKSGKRTLNVWCFSRK